jgi:hypothetical protein
MKIICSNLCYARPHPDPLLRGEGTAIARFDSFEALSGKYSHTTLIETAGVSPSPWGEGRGEGGRYN